MIVFSFVVIAANFAESQKVALASKIWMGLFTAHTVLLPVFGIVDFSAYDDLGDSASMVGICAPSNHGTAEYEARIAACRVRELEPRIHSERIA